MRAAMCLSNFHLARCQVHIASASLLKKFNNLSTKGENNRRFQLLRPNIYGLQGGNNRRWTQKSLSTNTEGKNITRRKTNIGQRIADVTSLTNSSSLNITRVENSECKTVPVDQTISENDDNISKLTTIICFDIETTGYLRDVERIIEIAFQVLSGGVNSTFQTLVNPNKIVTNSHVHGISTYMVRSPGVPRMEELIPIILQYVKSHQKPGGRTIFVAHNAKSFDVPFLIKEFKRCGYEIPPEWNFLDTMPFAWKLMKVEGSTLPKRSLQALREYYNIPLNGTAHRAMSDVNVLAMVLQKLTHDLKLTIPDLIKDHTFTASEVISNSKKKKDSK
ncbi:exonuclease DPD1, chloroplastic/mitochondrial [Rutidosis leptorrhynchoides]|uniref:exonuclease DPD1, chloroplastic/mitochondrial n=1 Tax=Rutidosis leptorrhynchoides TaxID=125765 RepID=UPI003A9A53BA